MLDCTLTRSVTLHQNGFSKTARINSSTLKIETNLYQVYWNFLLRYL